MSESARCCANTQRCPGHKASASEEPHSQEVCWMAPGASVESSSFKSRVIHASWSAGLTNNKTLFCEQFSVALFFFLEGFGWFRRWLEASAPDSPYVFLEAPPSRQHKMPRISTCLAWKWGSGKKENIQSSVFAPKFLFKTAFYCNCFCCIRQSVLEKKGGLYLWHVTVTDYCNCLLASYKKNTQKKLAQ